MKTQVRKTSVTVLKTDRFVKFNMRFLLLVFAFMLSNVSIFAHCDSYDGPVIKDAIKALDQNNVQLVLKWIDPQQEKEVISLFNKTYLLKNEDQQVYSIVEKYFFETLVRLHRETEGASYTGLKPEGSTTPFVVMADNSIETNDVEKVIKTATAQLEQVLRERYAVVAKLNKTKDKSVEQGRAYVKAYVVYTHTLEELEHIIEGPISHSK